MRSKYIALSWLEMDFLSQVIHNVHLLPFDILFNLLWSKVWNFIACHLGLGWHEVDKMSQYCLYNTGLYTEKASWILYGNRHSDHCVHQWTSPFRQWLEFILLTNRRQENNFENVKIHLVLSKSIILHMISPSNSEAFLTCWYIQYIFF
jgi:hypothetical protein